MSQLQHRGRSQAAASGVAADNDVVGGVAFLEQSVIDRDAIVESGGKRMFRSETIFGQQGLDVGRRRDAGREGAM